jgi:hypothetical protein
VHANYLHRLIGNLDLRLSLKKKSKAWKSISNQIGNYPIG